MARSNPCSPPATSEGLLALVDLAIDDAVRSLKEVPEHELLASRLAGRSRLPGNLLGVPFHAAEHTQRHTGQVIATSKIIRNVAVEQAAAPAARESP